MCKSKFKRGLMSVIALGMSVVMFCGCDVKKKGEENAEPVFRPDPNVEEPAKSEAGSEFPVETTTVNKYLERAKESKKSTTEMLEKAGISKDKRLGKDSNGNYVEKKCVNPYCGCVDCKCKPCECDDR